MKDKLTFYKTLSTLPIHNFYKIKFSGSLIYLLKEGDLENITITKEDIEELRSTWVALDAEFIERFAMNEEFINRILIEKTILLLKLEQLTTENPLLNNRIKAEEMKLNEGGNLTGEKFDVDKTVGHVEKYMGFQIDVFSTPVAKLYSYINQMQETAKKNA
jgi:hypothetical protein